MRLRSLLFVAVLATALVVAPSAQAAPVTCAIQGTMYVSQPLPLTGPAVTASYSVNALSVGAPACFANSPAAWIGLSGRVTGTCSSLTGSGGTPDNRRFNITGVGPELVLTGGVQGVITVYREDISQCGFYGVQQFRIAGTLTY